MKIRAKKENETIESPETAPWVNIEMNFGFFKRAFIELLQKHKGSDQSRFKRLSMECSP